MHPPLQLQLQLRLLISHQLYHLVRFGIRRPRLQWPRPLQPPHGPHHPRLPSAEGIPVVRAWPRPRPRSCLRQLHLPRLPPLLPSFMLRRQTLPAHHAHHVLRPAHRQLQCYVGRLVSSQCAPNPVHRARCHGRSSAVDEGPHHLQV
ncbi:hypothetical protein KSP39_PZI022290 [Platanthera zijinensis]|uniref:Uncharacterized protein n=1 Tax=Platanthera zijinensis TaxID=2320716 RepID=A0AAP0FUA4_9ASPA